MKKNLYVISSEKIFMENDYFYCDNIDMKSTPEGLNKFFNVKIIAKNSPIKRSHKIKISSIQILIEITINFNHFITHMFQNIIIIILIAIITIIFDNHIIIHTKIIIVITKINPIMFPISKITSKTT